MRWLDGAASSREPRHPFIMRRLLATIAVAGALAPVASAHTIWFHVSGIPPRNASGELDLHRIQRAIRDQVNHQFRLVWPGDPIAFGSAGIPIVIESYRQLVSDCLTDNADGCHAYVNGSPAIYVANNPGWMDTSISHEILETLVDPTGDTLDEVSDPVAGIWYTVDGQEMQDFVTPSYFNGGASPYDWKLAVKHPGQVLAGGIAP